LEVKDISAQLTILTIMADYGLLAALGKQQISSKVYESACNKRGSKVNVDQSHHLFV
jgi:hypothetical protein